MDQIGTDVALHPALQFCPWEQFDAAWYTATYLRRPNLTEPADPLAHYEAIGARRGLSPNRYFDEGWYRSRYPDVATLIARSSFATGFPSGFAHYCALGYLSHDPHWLFSDALYRARRGDLPNSALPGLGLRNGYHHYLIAGENENVSGSAFFDATLFAEATGITNHPFSALLGTPELAALRLSPYFEPDWYHAMYPDVAHEVAGGIYSSALHHYLANPAPERYQGSADFDEAFYLRSNPDVAANVVGGRVRCGYLHFLDHGRFADRAPSPWFDPVFYRRHPKVIADIREGRAASVFDHFLAIGRPLGLAPVAPVHARQLIDPIASELAAKEAFARMAHVTAATVLAAPAGRRAIVFHPPAVGETPEVSVVIAAYGQFDLTIQTLLSLSGSSDVSFEVILIDNGSTDEVRRIEAHVEGLTVLRNAENVGFLFATNQGIAAARGSFVLMLNNDVTVAPNALRMAYDRLASDPAIGAVGGKIVRTHGLLQEAGSLVFRDGSAIGYGRDGDPGAPEYNFLRDVDYCSGVFLMVPRALLRELGGLDPVFAPAYYEETDLCARIWQSGRRVVYDPAVTLVHLEYGSSRNPDAPRAQMLRNREIFVARNRAWLATKQPPDAGLALHGRIAHGRDQARQRRVLVIEDTIPYRHLGSGFVRSADVVDALVSLGWQVTVFPMNPVPPPARRRAGFDETVELLWDHDITDAPRVFAERETLYDAVWVCRAHNLHRLAGILGGDWGPLRHARVVLDTEALACNRAAASAALDGRSLDAATLLRSELGFAHLAHAVVAVNPAEAAQMQDFGLPHVHTLGHAITPAATPAGFAARHDILALGSLYAVGTPNFDGLQWFIAEVWPLVRPHLPGVRLLVAGFVKEGLDVAGLLAGDGVDHLGYVADAAGLYNQARLFVAPTRFSAGIPYKVHEAAAHGLPVVTTTLLAEQLAWRDGHDLLARSAADAAGFAAAVVEGYVDPAQWNALRAAALAKIAQDCSMEMFTETVRTVLG